VTLLPAPLVADTMRTIAAPVMTSSWSAAKRHGEIIPGQDLAAAPLQKVMDLNAKLSASRNAAPERPNPGQVRRAAKALLLREEHGASVWAV
jgi:hypothetical protein